MQRLQFKHWSHGTDSCGQICTLKASALLRIHFLLHPFCLRHAHPHQSEDLLDNQPSSLPYFFPLHLGINLLTRTEKVPFRVAGSRLSVRLLGATSKSGEDHPERPRIFILNCRNPVKTFNCWAVRWWGLTIELSGEWIPCTSQDCGVNTAIHFILLLPNYHLRPPEYCQRVQIHAGAVLSVCSPHCLAPTLSVRPC